MEDDSSLDRQYLENIQRPPQMIPSTTQAT